jgi:hypothetical protein
MVCDGWLMDELCVDERGTESNFEVDESRARFKAGAKLHHNHNRGQERLGAGRTCLANPA